MERPPAHTGGLLLEAKVEAFSAALNGREVR
jgi:hypothetical protein